MGIGQNIKSLIDKQNKTINEVAVNAKINPQTLYAIIKRDKPDQKVSPGILIKIANALDVTVNQLINNDAEPSTPKYYSRALYDFRARQGLTQKDFASKIGVPETTIKSWESGTWMPRMENLWSILDAFKISIADLFPDDENVKEMTKSEIHNIFDYRIKENIVIDVTLNPNHQISDIIRKFRSNEELTEDDQKVFNTFLESGFSQEAIENTTFYISSLGENLKYLHSICKKLNKVGQEKVLEHAEMLAEIPKYRKGTTEEQE